MAKKKDKKQFTSEEINKGRLIAAAKDLVEQMTLTDDQDVEISIDPEGSIDYLKDIITSAAPHIERETDQLEDDTWAVVKALCGEEKGKVHIDLWPQHDEEIKEEEQSKAEEDNDEKETENADTVEPKEESEAKPEKTASGLVKGLAPGEAEAREEAKKAAIAPEKKGKEQKKGKKKEEEKEPLSQQVIAERKVKREHFLAELRKGPKTMAEIKKAKWNHSGSTFYAILNQLISEGKAKKDGSKMIMI